jgi:hypothetical protein
MGAPSLQSRAWRTPLAIVGVLVVVGGMVVLGLRYYVHQAKTAEARYTLVLLAEKAAAAHARDGHVCASASRRIPEKMRSDCNGALTGIYQSQSADWRLDEARHAGFACLGFEIGAPQWYQYEYTATDDSFFARARTCVPELATLGAFEVRGHVRDGHMIVEDVVTIPNE